jgi:hypothetical protein
VAVVAAVFSTVVVVIGLVPHLVMLDFMPGMAPRLVHDRHNTGSFALRIRSA